MPSVLRIFLVQGKLGDTKLSEIGAWTAGATSDYRKSVRPLYGLRSMAVRTRSIVNPFYCEPYLPTKTKKTRRGVVEHAKVHNAGHRAMVSMGGAPPRRRSRRAARDAAREQPESSRAARDAARVQPLIYKCFCVGALASVAKLKSPIDTRRTVRHVKRFYNHFHFYTRY